MSAVLFSSALGVWVPGARRSRSHSAFSCNAEVVRCRSPKHPWELKPAVQRHEWNFCDLIQPKRGA